MTGTIQDAWHLTKRGFRNLELRKQKRGNYQGNETRKFPGTEGNRTADEWWFCNGVQPRGGPQTGICNGVQKSLEISGSTPQGHTCTECWQLWPIVGGAGDEAAEEDWRWI